MLLNSRDYKLYQQDLEHNRRDCEAERKAEQGKHTKECQSLLYRTLDDPVSIFTAILTLATVGLFTATAYLWRATRDLVQGADATAERQLRAYVGKERVSFIRLDAGPRVSVKINYRNYGKTPACDFDVRLKIGYAPHPPSQDPTFVYDQEIVEDASLMPNATGVSICSVDVNGIPNVRNAIGTSAIAIYLFGTIVYRDVFGKPHVAKVTMLATGDRALSDSPFIYLPYGNEEY